MKSRSLRATISTVSLSLLGSAALLAPACAGSPTCQDYGNCSGGTGAAAGSSGTSNDAGSGGDPSGGGTQGQGGKGGKGGGGSEAGSTTGGSVGAGGGGAGGVDGGAGMTGGGGSGGDSCEPSLSPTEESCLVTDEYAVFVSPAGDDTSNGSQGAPFATLTKAVEAAAGAKLVLVCDATYGEHVVITAGARIYGGFKCTDWTAETAKPLFKPTTAGPALKIDGVDEDVLIEGLSFEVGDAVAPGETALTALVNESPKVTLRAVSLKAGKGKAGANGTLTAFTFPARSELDGNDANGTAGGQPKVVSCPGGAETSGGIGGTAAPTGQPGSDGAPFIEAGKGEGGTPGTCSTGLGGDGASAPNAPAAKGAEILGTLLLGGWSTGSGGDGANGSPGQGGGGGASTKTGGGGGGGAGACGGAGAKGGQGGGASIALAMLQSVVALEVSEIVTADAGNGGGSAAGQGGDKDQGFAGDGAPGACDGGNGGLGGDGGAGGGGAGGISVGILWKGAMAPTVSSDSTITIGKAGAKGIGGVPGTNDGVAGIAEKIHALN